MQISTRIDIYDHQNAHLGTLQIVVPLDVYEVGEQHPSIRSSVSAWATRNHHTIPYLAGRLTWQIADATEV